MRTLLALLAVVFTTTGVSVAADGRPNGSFDLRLSKSARWTRLSIGGERSVTMRRDAGVTFGFRLRRVGEQRPQAWYREGIRAANKAGALLVRDPEKRRVGAHTWTEARFRTAMRDRRTVLTTVQCFAVFGPYVLEGYVRAPRNSMARALREFDRLRETLRVGEFDERTTDERCTRRPRRTPRRASRR